MNNDTIKEIKFSELSAARGRNGIIRMSGLEIMPSQGGTTVMLSPLTSKGKPSDACWLEIPLENIPELIADLKNRLNGTTFAPKPEKTP